jgi:hypothetical protein
VRYFLTRLLPSVQTVEAAVPSFASTVDDGDADGAALGVLVADGVIKEVTFPSFQSVPTSSTTGETNELSKVKVVIPVEAPKTLASASFAAL